MPMPTLFAVVKLFWQPGEPKPQSMFGSTIPRTVQLDNKNWMDVIAYRCPECGLVRLYAPSKVAPKSH
jgi:hypothetical protein